MKKTTLFSYILLLLSTISISNVFADTSFNGFASIIGGKVIDGEKYYAVYPDAGIYDDNFSLSPESLVGVQMRTAILEDLTFTAQVVLRANDDFKLEKEVIEWAYLTYNINKNFTVQAGRKGLPLFLYSDSVDIRYSYDWMRPPGETYSLDFKNYNGVNLLYKDIIFGEWALLGNLFFGEEKPDENKLFTKQFGTPVIQDQSNIKGASFSMSDDIYTLRLSHMRTDIERHILIPSLGEFRQTLRDAELQFSGIAVKADYGDYYFISEYTTYKFEGIAMTSRGESPTDDEFYAWYASAGYRYDDFTFTATYATYVGQKTEFLLNQNDPSQGTTFLRGRENNTVTLGVKYDILSYADLRIEFNQIEDKGVYPLSGDAKIISVGMNFFF
ncbi:MAG: hypothetical protein ACI9T7_000382 [Oleiphilaceae bacterium]|jgi:hypothetical protein